MTMPEHLPPDIQAAIEAAQAADAHAHRTQVDNRKAMLRFAAILCRCTPWHDRAEVSPPQAGCPVHGTVMVTLDGEVL